MTIQALLARLDKTNAPAAAHYRAELHRYTAMRAVTPLVAEAVQERLAMLRAAVEQELRSQLKQCRTCQRTKWREQFAKHRNHCLACYADIKRLERNRRAGKNWC